MTNPIRFRASYSVAKLALNEGTHYRIPPDGEYQVEIELGDGRDLDDKPILRLDVGCTYSVNDRRLQMLNGLEKGKLPKSEKPHPPNDSIDADGNFEPGRWFTLEYLPSTLNELYHDEYPTCGGSWR